MADMRSALFARSRVLCKREDAKIFSPEPEGPYAPRMLKSPTRWLTLLPLLATAHAAPAPKTSPTKTAPHAEVVAFWRFEPDAKPETHSSAGPAKRVDGAEFFFTDDVPGPFIYDPLQKL